MSDTPNLEIEQPSSAGAPPVADVATRAAEPVYSPGQIALATLFATPIAGALLASTNFARAGRGVVAKAVVIVATLVVAAVVGLDVVGYGALTLWMTPAWTMLVWALAARAFGEQARVTGALPLKRVVVVVAGIWLAFAGAAGAMAAWTKAHVPSAEEIAADAVAYSPREIVSYGDGATREDAERFSRALVATHLFTGEGALKVTLTKPANTYRFTMLADPPVTPSDIDVMRKISKKVAQHLDACVQGHVVGPNGAVLASGTSCP